MKIIAGLGNPGAKYKNTRHNVGFMVVDELAARFGVEKEECKYDGIIGHIRIGDEKVLLLKPLTYMNLSGRAVAPLVRFYKLELKDLLVIYDDMDLPLGSLRIRTKGSAGGHKGVSSIIESLNSREFPRIRLGIGRPESDTIDWVLGKFTLEEEPIIRETVEKAADAAECWVLEGIEKAMNKYN
ncbi:aminoacyl-tRNA hydrolase [Thermosyntropha sp.]|uniref:aminoacyl-tRNA hydrolase n=1 Tax=Thermosyntropha sp. TaxID=2740820 RepID=UPI0025EDF289|nr:aminoacyl-tRNA hydrolase [Thermosyntropha sp.]MBO8159780.1 aminoacyl-tRNA hydrolase [Thermosyntropha sp.]